LKSTYKQVRVNVALIDLRRERRRVEQKRIIGNQTTSGRADIELSASTIEKRREGN